MNTSSSKERSEVNLWGPVVLSRGGKLGSGKEDHIPAGQSEGQWGREAVVAEPAPLQAE